MMTEQESYYYIQEFGKLFPKEAGFRVKVDKYGKWSRCEFCLDYDKDVLNYCLKLHNQFVKNKKGVDYWVYSLSYFVYIDKLPILHTKKAKVFTLYGLKYGLKYTYDYLEKLKTYLKLKNFSEEVSL